VQSIKVDAILLPAKSVVTVQRLLIAALGQSAFTARHR